MPLPVGIYARLSDDKDGEKLGVQRQLDDGLQLCTLRHWNNTKNYIDPSLSAFKRRVIRPQFEQLLEDLTNGGLAGLVVYDLDRLVRQPRDLERLIEVYDTRPTLTFATVQGDINLASPDGRTMARVMVAFANKSSMDTARRVTREKLSQAQAGVPISGHRPFGWQPGGAVIEPREAQLIRDAARRIVDDGVSIYRIAAEWNSAGILTPRGNAWSDQSLTRMLSSPRLAGWRIYQRKIAVDAAGEPVRGQWEPILSQPGWEDLRAALQPRMKDTRPKARKYLLSGLLVCGECMGKMGSSSDKKRRTHSYHCLTTNGKGCGKCSVSGPQLDKLIEDLILAKKGETTSETAAEHWPGVPALMRLEEQIVETTNAYREGNLPAAVAFPLIAKFNDEAEALRVARDIDTRNAPRAITAGLAEQWPDLTTEDRREIIASVLRVIIVRRAAYSGQRFLDVGRVEPVPRRSERP